MGRKYIKSQPAPPPQSHLNRFPNPLSSTNYPLPSSSHRRGDLAPFRSHSIPFHPIARNVFFTSIRLRFLSSCSQLRSSQPSLPSVLCPLSSHNLQHLLRRHYNSSLDLDLLTWPFHPLLSRFRPKLKTITYPHPPFGPSVSRGLALAAISGNFISVVA